MMTKEVYIKLVNFMTTRDGVVVLRCRHIGDTLKILIYLKSSTCVQGIGQTNWVMMSNLMTPKVVLQDEGRGC